MRRLDEEAREAHASAVLWDPASASFGSAGSLAQGRGEHSATLLSDGRVLVIGGSSNDAVARGPALVWDSAAASFEPAASPAEPRTGHTATLLPDGRILIVGGNGGIAAAEVWEPGERQPKADDVATATRDLLPGVDLVTEEVEPGVERVLSDGIHDLSGVGRAGAQSHAEKDGLAVAPNGAVWLVPT